MKLPNLISFFNEFYLDNIFWFDYLLYCNMSSCMHFYNCSIQWKIIIFHFIFQCHLNITNELNPLIISKLLQISSISFELRLYYQVFELCFSFVLGCWIPLVQILEKLKFVFSFYNLTRHTFGRHALIRKLSRTYLIV